MFNIQWFTIVQLPNRDMIHTQFGKSCFDLTKSTTDDPSVLHDCTTSLQLKLNQKKERKKKDQSWFKSQFWIDTQ